MSGDVDKAFEIVLDDLDEGAWDVTPEGDGGEPEVEKYRKGYADLMKQTDRLKERLRKKDKQIAELQAEVDKLRGVRPNVTIESEVTYGVTKGLGPAGKPVVALRILKEWLEPRLPGKKIDYYAITAALQKNGFERFGYRGGRFSTMVGGREKVLTFYCKKGEPLPEEILRRGRLDVDRLFDYVGARPKGPKRQERGPRKVPGWDT